MPSSIRLILTVFTAALCQTAVSFSVPDAFHLASLHTAATAQVGLHHQSHTLQDAAGHLLQTYKNSLLNNPLSTKMATGATLAVCGDAIAQSQTSDEYDKRRASSFAVFDMAYRALQHVAFPIIVQNCVGNVLSGIPGVDQHAAAAMEQTLASQLGIVPFLYYPAFFALTGVVQGLTVDGSIERAKENFLPLMQRNLLFWIPVQFVQFGFIAPDLQIPFLSVCGLGWTFILSVAAGSAKKYSADDDADVMVDLADEMMISAAAVDQISEDMMAEVALQTAVIVAETEADAFANARRQA